MKTGFHWMTLEQLPFIGYKKTGSWSMHGMNIRHYWFGFIFFGFRYTQIWGE